MNDVEYLRQFGEGYSHLPKGLSEVADRMRSIAKRLELYEADEAKYKEDQTTLLDQFAMAALTGVLAHYGANNEEDGASDKCYLLAEEMREARKRRMCGD